MSRKILLATATVVGVTLLVGAIAVVLMARGLTSTAEDELARQALVTAQLIEEDLEDLRFRPGTDTRQQVDRFRSELNRSLGRAQVVGGQDVIEAVLRLPNRTVPITEPLIVMPKLPPDTSDGDVVTIEIDGRNMLVAVEKLDLQLFDIVVAIGRFEPLLPVKEVTVALIAALGIGAMLTVSLGVWLSRSVASRLSDVSDAAREVGSGDLAARATVSGDDEITDMARSFNHMAAELEDVREREQQFLMAVSHDLRTPLTTISGYAEALDAGDVSQEDLSRVAGILHGQTEQLSRLVEDLMALARVDAREFTMAPETVDISQLTSGVVDGYRPRADTAGVSIDVECSEPLPILVDPQRLIQVLDNLLDNALRYTPEAGKISVACRGDGRGTATISVTNSGPGISPTDLPHVFERLYVADRYRAQRPAGSGLGLAIVAELVDAMGGTVSCESAPDIGTTFLVTIG
ncbi:MAG: HAMP domain-containing histidine kinase [Actinomycetia bacterium]|nr:HAMP domain-containing histidine kinase [Actinomycetes bacterium]